MHSENFKLQVSDLHSFVHSTLTASPSCSRHSQTLLAKHSTLTSSLVITTFRKDDTPFWNHLHVAPVRSATGKVAYFVGVQLDVSIADLPMRGDSLRADAKQLSAVGVVRVAVRSLQGCGLRRIPKA